MYVNTEDMTYGHVAEGEASGLFKEVMEGRMDVLPGVVPSRDVNQALMLSRTYYSPGNALVAVSQNPKPIRCCEEKKKKEHRQISLNPIWC